MAARQTNMTLLFQHSVMNVGTESAVLATPILVLFRATPIPKLFAVRVFRSCQDCNDHISQGTHKDSYAPAQAVRYCLTSQNL